MLQHSLFEFHIACLLKMGYGGGAAITRATGMPKTTVHRKIGRIRQFLGDELTENGTKQHKEAAAKDVKSS